MFTEKATKTLIILVILLFTFSDAEGNDLYCVSLKGFKISSKIRYRVLNFDFDVSNAEIYSVLHNPLGWSFDIYNGKDWSGGFGGGTPVGAGGTTLDYFYDDFVVIKKRPGVKLSEIKLELSLQTDENPIDETAA